MSKRTGVLILNLGTPDDTSTTSVRRYLRQFLSDPRVLDIPALGRWLLLNVAILPFRPKESAEAYKQIWTDRGSPLKFHTEDLTTAVQTALGDQVSVKYAMRYQNPSMNSVLQAFHEEGVERLVVAPLYPQYASSSTGSCLEELYRLCAEKWNAPSLTVLPPFYDHPAFVKSQAVVAREALGDLEQYDHFLISFHGLPERQVKKCDLSGNHCLVKQNCCDKIEAVNRYCYRAQSYESARLLTRELGISDDKYTVGFQSRLGRTPWIQPYTDHLFDELAARGVKKLAVMVPSFTADCLETIEEIGMRGREQFQTAGGQELVLVPSQNAHPAWIEALITMIREMGPT